jgi:oligopeptide transport system permease protein
MWWLVLFPSLALGATLLALNFLGDGLRDALDPKMKRR